MYQNDIVTFYFNNEIGKEGLQDSHNELYQIPT